VIEHIAIVFFFDLSVMVPSLNYYDKNSITVIVKLYVKCPIIPYHNVLYFARSIAKTIPNGISHIMLINDKCIMPNKMALMNTAPVEDARPCKFVNINPRKATSSKIAGCKHVITVAHSSG